jgi:hypothetical protein
MVDVVGVSEVVEVEAVTVAFKLFVSFSNGDPHHQVGGH